MSHAHAGGKRAEQRPRTSLGEDIDDHPGDTVLAKVGGEGVEFRHGGASRNQWNVGLAIGNQHQDRAQALAAAALAQDQLPGLDQGVRHGGGSPSGEAFEPRASQVNAASRRQHQGGLFSAESNQRHAAPGLVGTPEDGQGGALGGAHAYQSAAAHGIRRVHRQYDQLVCRAVPELAAEVGPQQCGDIRRGGLAGPGPAQGGAAQGGVEGKVARLFPCAQRLGAPVTAGGSLDFGGGAALNAGSFLDQLANVNLQQA